jgi:hypothetical protein
VGSLNAYAVGEAPLQYQWSKNGSIISGATNSILQFLPIQLVNAGTYSLLITNQHGTVQSVGAVLNVTSVTGGGIIVVNTFTNNAPTMDVDGSTRLSGATFRAQVYAGAAPNSLHPIGPAVNYSSGNFAGFIGYPSLLSRTMPDVPAGQTAYVQIRAWEAALGGSYDQARAAGGKFGFSKIFPTVTSAFGTRVLTQSFFLRAGEPFFVAGLLGIGNRMTNGT